MPSPGIQKYETNYFIVGIKVVLFRFVVDLFYYYYLFSIYCSKNTYSSAAGFPVAVQVMVSPPYFFYKAIYK